MPVGESTSSSGVDVCLVGVELAVRYLRLILENQPNVRVFSEEAISHGGGGTAQPQSPVFVVDMDSIHDSLAKCLRSLRASAPQAKIVLLGGELSAEELCSLLFLGIDGFVPYRETADKLLLAIEAVSEGHPWIEPSVLEEFLGYSRVAGSGHGRHLRPGVQLRNSGRDGLTTREKLILGLVQRRFSNKEIALALSISENTVKFHLSNIFMKVGVHDRHSATRFAGSYPSDKAQNEHPMVAGQSLWSRAK